MLIAAKGKKYHRHCWSHYWKWTCLPHPLAFFFFTRFSSFVWNSNDPCCQCAYSFSVITLWLPDWISAGGSSEAQGSSHRTTSRAFSAVTRHSVHHVGHSFRAQGLATQFWLLMVMFQSLCQQLMMRPLAECSACMTLGVWDFKPLTCNLLFCLASPRWD